MAAQVDAEHRYRHRVWCADGDEIGNEQNFTIPNNVQMTNIRRQSKQRLAQVFDGTQCTQQKTKSTLCLKKMIRTFLAVTQASIIWFL